LSDSFSIKRASETDIGAIKRIEEECDLSPWPESDYREEIKKTGNLFFIAGNKNEIAGFILARLITNNNKHVENSEFYEIEIYNLGVRKEFRGLNLGTRLLQELSGRMGLECSGNIYLEVRKKNMGAIIFYKKCGFEIIGERRAFYINPPDDAVLMQRSYRGGRFL